MERSFLRMVMGGILIGFLFLSGIEASNSATTADVVLAESKGTTPKKKVTAQPMKLTLVEAVKKNYVRFSAHGSSIQSSYIKIENLTNNTIHLLVPAGTFLSANAGNYQNMVLTRPHDIVLHSKKTYSENVSTACMNLHRSIPNDKNAFKVAQRPADNLLTKVIKLLSQGNYSYGVIQAAVWIVTDNASFATMGTLQNQYRQRVITNEDYQKAVAIVNKAKKMK